ncbi:MAG: hypothetical protein LBQ31_08760 [Bacteroidales bacterium]|jgi:hypothetical protein|nr:hypothetical protein [Bacteroidales bacterium]
MTQEKKKNGVGMAGMVLAIIALALCWLPVFNWILWGVGLILSVIGVFKKPRTLAFVGLGISLAGIILIIVLMATVLGALS